MYGTLTVKSAGRCEHRARDQDHGDQHHKYRDDVEQRAERLLVAAHCTILASFGWPKD